VWLRIRQIMYKQAMPKGLAPQPKESFIS
jgi:hypothetical protein